MCKEANKMIKILKFLLILCRLLWPTVSPSQEFLPGSWDLWTPDKRIRMKNPVGGCKVKNIPGPLEINGMLSLDPPNNTKGSCWFLR